MAQQLRDSVPNMPQSLAQVAAARARTTAPVTFNQALYESLPAYHEDEDDRFIVSSGTQEGKKNPSRNANRYSRPF
jgi:hypothetical protein